MRQYRLLVSTSNLPYCSSHGSVGNFPKTLALLLLSWAKIQYARDGEGPDL
jgi:hypothetical protein